MTVFRMVHSFGHAMPANYNERSLPKITNMRVTYNNYKVNVGASWAEGSNWLNVIEDASGKPS